MEILANSTTDKTEALYRAVMDRRPVLAKVINQYGDISLEEYSQTFGENKTEPIQPGEEVADAVSKVYGGLLGEPVTSKLRDRLVGRKVILTANHHGVDYFGLTIQGSLIFSLGEATDGIVPILACGNVPLNNATFGRGILLARPGSRLNVFSNKYAHCLVSAAPGMTPEMVNNAKIQLRDLKSQKKIGAPEESALGVTLDYYHGSKVMEQKNYSDQSVLINGQLWNEIFSADSKSQKPDIAYIEQEKIVAELVKKDLSNQGSFMFKVLFDDQLRNRVLDNLSSVYGCWDKSKLDQLLNPDVQDAERKELVVGAGTAFFWGVDGKGERFPLALKEAGDGKKLVRIDKPQLGFEVPFTPDALAEHLETGELLPSLFITFTSLAFVRGYKCYGGFMQTDYLTSMKEKLALSLQETSHQSWSDQVLTVPTENYTTGMIVAVAAFADGLIQPAGTIELMAKGGLDENDLNKIGRLTIKEANALGLPDMYSIIYREDERDTKLSQMSREEIYQQIADRIVTINL